MQRDDQTESTNTEKVREEAIEPAPANPVAEIEIEKKTSPAVAEAGENETAASKRKSAGFDWLAMGIVILTAAFFALTARFNSQPAPSYIPAAALSATGCGLLVTALRKLRTIAGAGLIEAALGGFFLALFQFAVSFTYPGVFTTITTAPAYGRAFLITWGLVGLFAVVMSLAGAAIGHLAFAPLRTLPERAVKQKSTEELEDEESEVEESESSQTNETVGVVETEEGKVENESTPTTETTGITETEEEDEGEKSSSKSAVTAQARDSLINYAITILLLGLLPMMIGYVFAAAYDFTMNTIHADQISPALYPTLSLLGAMLPWRLAVPINLGSSNGSFIVFTLLWRIPDSFLGNPNTFDVQALEPFIFNGAALALLLITMYGRAHHGSKQQSAPWSIFICFELLLGLVLVLPASLWIRRGLEGVLQMQNLVVQLPTIQLLNPTMFILNLVTGPVVCLLIGLIVRRQYQLWSMPRKENEQAHSVE